MKIIRFGCHSFLNAKPVINYLSVNKDCRESVEIVLGSPAEISEKLSSAEIDTGFIPSIEFLKNKDLFLIPGFSISACGKVMSVLLESHKYIKDIKSVAVDSRSRTSIVLLKIILAKKYGISPVFLSPDTQIGSYRADARLIIGDEALELTYGKKTPFYMNITDLSQEWYEMTGLPFVFAVIASRKKEAPSDFLNLLSLSRDEGIRNIQGIAQEECEKCRITTEAVVDYLNNRISYSLSEKEMEGLKEFQKLASDAGLLDSKRDISVVQAV